MSVCIVLFVFAKITITVDQSLNLPAQISCWIGFNFLLFFHARFGLVLC